MSTCRLQKLIKEKRQARLEKEKKVGICYCMNLSYLFVLIKEALEKEKSRRKGGREMVEAKQRYGNKWLAGFALFS